MKRAGRLRTSKKDFPTATQMGSAEQDIVATAMSYTGTIEKLNRTAIIQGPNGRIKLADLGQEFWVELFKKCRVLRRLLHQLHPPKPKTRRKRKR
jgi:Mn-dependent DtxR family transcriptional regulator